MKKIQHPTPTLFQGVMVSSTFTDLYKHRASLIKAIEAHDLKAVVMENDSAKPDVDVLDSSLQMVRKASAYVGVISHKYGQIPDCSERNPQRLSLTELEFHEACRLERPVLLFIMGENHDVKLADVEKDPEKIGKLNAFRENAKRFKEDSPIHRVYKVFNDLHEFEVVATQSIANLRLYLEDMDEGPDFEPGRAEIGKGEPPKPPAFYAEPPYLGSHEFVGRQAQLEILSDWAAPADPHPILLFEAIGGTGKSILTWEWTTKYATAVRGDWAGRFWYSFYERGAIMADFCRRALAYITGQPLENFLKMKTLELGDLLLHQLRNHPWLLILDGLERVLVAYHRYDAPQVADEKAGTTDEIGHRDPCTAIRPEDDDLLRALAAAAPSKLLLTTRLVPRVLLNAARQPVPGVLRIPLPGLRPADAEALLRSCGVTGASQDIQRYLKSHCDCHPLVTGVLAGLINDYLPDRGNFDAWAADPIGGDKLNLASLDLVQKRNHILLSALDALSAKSRQLLSILALLPVAIDYSTLTVFNPFLPPKPTGPPGNPEDEFLWPFIPDDQRKQEQQDYVDRKMEYERALEAWLHAKDSHSAQQALTEAIRDLERRGLLQFDARSKRFDLHPVVRGIAAGKLQPEEKERYGRRVVDYFSQQTQRPYEEVETLEDVQDGLHVVRTLLQMGRSEEALMAYGSGLSQALSWNLEAHAEELSILRAYFPKGWRSLPQGLSEHEVCWLTNALGTALNEIGNIEEAIASYGTSLSIALRGANWKGARVCITNLGLALKAKNRLAQQERWFNIGLDLSSLLGRKDDLFRARLDLFDLLAMLGRFDEAEELWQLLHPMGRDWNRGSYRPGQAEKSYAEFRFRKGDLLEQHLCEAEKLAVRGRDRSIIRSIHCLRGEWQLRQGAWGPAADSLQKAVQMAREVGQAAPVAETCLAFARLRLQQLPNSMYEAEQLSQARARSDGDLAKLWLALGDEEQAKKHALAAYKWAWADGEPYVRRYELDQARSLLNRLGEEVPNLPAYDPTKDEKLPREGEVVAAIEKLRAEVDSLHREQSS